MKVRAVTALSVDILAAVAVVIWLRPSGIGTVSEDPVLSTAHRLELIRNHVARWAAQYGRLPTEDDLAGVFPETTSRAEMMRDAWHNTIRYQVIATDPPCVFAYSIGPDGIDNEGSGDDIRPRENVCAAR